MTTDSGSVDYLNVCVCTMVIFYRISNDWYKLKKNSSLMKPIATANKILAILTYQTHFPLKTTRLPLAPSKVGGEPSSIAPRALGLSSCFVLETID